MAQAKRAYDPVQADVAGAEARCDQSEKQLDFWINCMGSPVLVVEKGSRVVSFSNKTAKNFFVHDASSLVGLSIDALLGVPASLLLTQIWSIPENGAISEPFIIKAMVNDKERFLLTHVTFVRVEGRDLRLYSFRDTPPSDTLGMVKWQMNLMELLNWLPLGFEVATNRDEVQFVNSGFKQMFGYDLDQLEDVDDWWRLAYPDPDYRAMARQKWEDEIAAARRENREMTPFDLDVKTADGETRRIQFRHRAIGHFHLNLYLDVTAERLYAQRMQKLAEIDPLTGLLNRRSFFEQTAEILSGDQSEDAGHVVLMLDIDHFKQLNDVHGHAVGDLALEQFARCCHGAVRGHDSVARLGGEEFCVLLRSVTLDKALDVAERIRSSTEAMRIDSGDEPVKITVSIGLSQCLAGENTVDQALRRADRLLYEAKMGGRNRIAHAPASNEQR
ncbi:diguanylate cyclase (GGDEF)-like protein [Rhizobium sp. SG_E_25_P2]|jgi:diguanylate cyclase (GGDEF)-like protein|uniref:sensor domain-containing diguanylate cyclase n=1 Tax=Rhizobium sp. SG_E_25_P2 TaxID=2879942 RepID=UPI0024739D6A|nr:sensor domain-containing diguanylate cyclase [Rhizobium sp. SG_E_25_P2]MDH6266747.1 diguanylate cyclase (GGDEF)-like protein [Rhizobium sp. SG_E_25_P2]